jgi:serine/threonine protein kinase/tetratricopeptide (TPR) repeat protein
MAIDSARARSIFLEAIENHPPQEWQAYLEAACGNDMELRRRAEALLKAHEGEDPLLDHGLVKPERIGINRRQPEVGEGPGRVIGSYTLRELIGEGGMGLVFVAEQQKPVRRKVALKLVKPGMDTKQVIARFEAERQALAMMDHPNIAKVHDGGVTPAGRPYFVMELVKGLPITDYCDKSRLGTRQRLELFLDVCHAVQHAHQKGIIHRDLKPSNILVEVHDVRPVVKVIDFGISKAIGQQLTDKTLYTGLAHMVGTPIYMSPEQAGLSSLDVDTRSDVYSLGVLLYELLTGTTPFESETLKKAGYDEMRRIIREEEPAKPSTRLSTLQKAALSTIAEQRGLEPGKLPLEVRGELDWMVMRALEKDRDRRYESASALAADVLCYLNDEPVTACPPSAGYRLRKYVRRNRRALIPAAIVAFALVTATAVSTWQAVRATEAQRLAETDRERAKEAEQHATTEVAIARAVNDFLQGDVLRQVDGVPQFTDEFVGDPKLTVKEALDRAAAKIGERFGDQPLVEAAIRLVIGQAYCSLSDDKRGVPHLERAFELRQKHLGLDHPDTLASMSNLANAYHWAGQHQKAIALRQRMLENRTAMLGPDHADTLECTAGLADAYYFAGEWGTSVALWEEVCRKRTTIFGPTHPSTLGAMHQLALNYYLGLDRVTESMALHEKVLDGLKSTYGPEHELMNWPMVTLAQVCQRAGKFDRADQLLRAVLERLGKQKGSLAVRNGRANALGWLALNFLLQEQYDEAEPFVRKAIAIDQIDKPRRFYWMTVLGAVLLGQKKYEEAESFLLQGYEGMKQYEATLRVPQRRFVAEAGSRVVRFYELTNQPEKARVWQEKVNAKLPNAASGGAK